MPEPKRNRFHSLCPYFAMFPESFVETWVERLTKPRQIVLDPFCGRGTTPFQSLLMGRKTVGCDVNPVAYCISRAKTDCASAAAVRRRLTQLEEEFDSQNSEAKRVKMPEFFLHAFSPKTLKQLLYLRSKLKWQNNRTDCMIAALTLGALHGESNRSPSYLSNQMPRTISTKPEYSVRYWKKHGDQAPRRDVFRLIRERVDYRYESTLPVGDAEIFLGDMRRLPTMLNRKRVIRFVITSPPYFDVTNFEEDQWLRLWFLGGPPRPTRGRFSRDDRHGESGKYWTFIADMWRMLGHLLTKKAEVVIRLGTSRGDAEELPNLLSECAKFSQRTVSLVSEEISPIQRRQTDSFRPGSSGCRFEVDCHFHMN